MTLIIKADSALTAPIPDTPIIAPPLVADTFTRADGAMGTTEVGGLAWEPVTGVIQVTGGAAQAATASGATGCMWLVGTTLTTGSVHATALTGDAYVVFRANAGGDAYLFGRSTSQGEFRLYKRQSGAVTTLAGATAPPFADPERYTVEMRSGGQMVCKVNGVTVIDHADTSVSGTRSGLRFFVEGSRADNFAVFA